MTSSCDTGHRPVTQARHARASALATHIIMLIQDLDIRIIDAATGELLRQLVLDPTRNYQPTGRPPGPQRPQQKNPGP
jgi:hypothetical protein